MRTLPRGAASLFDGGTRDRTIAMPFGRDAVEHVSKDCDYRLSHPVLVAGVDVARRVWGPLPDVAVDFAADLVSAEPQSLSELRPPWVRAASPLIELHLGSPAIRRLGSHPTQVLHVSGPKTSVIMRVSAGRRRLAPGVRATRRSANVKRNQCTAGRRSRGNRASDGPLFSGAEACPLATQ